jgi:formylglycine-generating enzyme required for sulfatase activity
MTTNLPLRVFLSCASLDKESLYAGYGLHFNEDWIDSWDENFEGIDGARIPDVILVCLTKNSITEEGFIQKEIGYAMDLVDENPEGTIFVLVVRLEDCHIPGRLRRWQCVDYFKNGAREELTGILQKYFENKSRTRPAIHSSLDENDPDLYKFIRVELSRKSSTPYVFWIGKYPVTNAQYERFLDADDFAKGDFWHDFLRFDSNCNYRGRWVNDGLEFLEQERLNRPNLGNDTALMPAHWHDSHFGTAKRNNPVVGISWFEANAYTKWLLFHWYDLMESRTNSDLNPQLLRLPLETEWHFAARGDSSDRSPWGSFSMKFGENAIQEEIREVMQRANVKESHAWCTTPVDAYPKGASKYGVMDMFGNVWEWLANESPEDDYLPPFLMAVRGGSWDFTYQYASFGDNLCVPKERAESDLGFRLIALPVIE